MDLFRPFLLAFIPLFVAIDALGILPIFLSLTESLSKEERRRTFREAIWAAGLVGIGFMLLGKAIFVSLAIHDSVPMTDADLSSVALAFRPVGAVVNRGSRGPTSPNRSGEGRETRR